MEGKSSVLVEVELWETECCGFLVRTTPSDERSLCHEPEISKKSKFIKGKCPGCRREVPIVSKLEIED